MKILFTGGGTGGHFYPLLAVADELLRIADEKNLVRPTLYYLADQPYDEKQLLERDIIFLKAPAGKLRRYFSVLNFFSPFLTFFGIIKALFILFSIFPDVVFSKGGYVSIPTVWAARILGIPIFIHDSDAIPGRANLWAGKFAYRIGISYPQAAEYFKRKEALALVGNPVRPQIAHPATQGAHEHFEFSRDTPTLLILGGSQGSKKINEIILEALPDLVLTFQIIHQTGVANYDGVQKTAEVVLEENPYRSRYKPYGYLNDLLIRMGAGACDLIVSRAGSNSIFEIASWGKPSILIPISESVSRDQRKNAFAYARTGAAMVIEEDNLSPHVLTAELRRIIESSDMRERMAKAGESFRKPDAATKIAEELIAISLEHEEQ